MSESQYRVILYCSRSDQDLIERLKAELQAQLALSGPEVQTLFSGQPIVLHQTVDAGEAERIKTMVEAAGGSCDIEPLSHQRTVDDLGFVERRAAQRRRPGDRRQQPRPGRERREGERRRNRYRIRNR